MDAIETTKRRVPRSSIVTASYAPDFERCRLLCETIDRHVSGFEKHYLLVEEGDVSLFRQLESSRRIVVDERDLLPPWLRSFGDPASGFRRRIWLSLKTMPLRGWHVQQLRRIAIAAHVDEEALIYCDSDVAFVKPFDCGVFWKGETLRLFRREGALLGPVDGNHRLWSKNAGVALGLREEISPHDYIATLIAWRRDAVTAMCSRIEEVQGRHWVQAVASTRHFSECMLYGRYADEVLEGEGHFHDGAEICRIHWKGEPLSDEALREFVQTLAPDQVAIGMQSFIGTDLGRIRRLIPAD